MQVHFQEKGHPLENIPRHVDIYVWHSQRVLSHLDQLNHIMFIFIKNKARVTTNTYVFINSRALLRGRVEQKRAVLHELWYNIRTMITLDWSVLCSVRRHPASSVSLVHTGIKSFGRVWLTWEDVCEPYEFAKSFSVSHDKNDPVCSIDREKEEREKKRHRWRNACA